MSRRTAQAPSGAFLPAPLRGREWTHPFRAGTRVTRCLGSRGVLNPSRRASAPTRLSSSSVTWVIAGAPDARDWAHQDALGDDCCRPASSTTSSSTSSCICATEPLAGVLARGRTGAARLPATPALAGGARCRRQYALVSIVAPLRVNNDVGQRRRWTHKCRTWAGSRLATAHASGTAFQISPTEAGVYWVSARSLPCRAATTQTRRAQ